MGNNTKQTEKWENIVKTVSRRRSSFKELLTDENIRVRMQFFCIFAIFSIVSAAMTIVNVYTSWHLLMLSTLIFAIANVVNILLMLINEKTERLTRYLFAVEILSLFAFFLIFGEPEGFSAIWIALLPACGLLLYRMKYGTFLSAVQLALLIFLFWTDAGRSLLMFQYTDSFMLRFPLLYIAFFFVGFFFEFIRHTTQKELAVTRSEFEHLSKHDPLTGLFNRFGYYENIEQTISEGIDGCALAIIDFDNFKTINDSYGHLNGDVVLKKSSEAIGTVVGDMGSVCRWGGDELSVFFKSAEASEKLCGEILTTVRALDFEFMAPKHITASIGLTVVSRTKAFDIANLIAVADKNLYLSKNCGKDRVNVTEYVPSEDNNDEEIRSVLT